MPLLNDLYGVDRTPRVTIKATVHNPKPPIRHLATVEFGNITEYSYDSDILNLGDPFAVSIPNPGGQYSGVLHVGDAVTFHIADPEVAGGQEVCRLAGIITKLTNTADHTGGRITVQGADLGWHLNNNCAPLWTSYRSMSFKEILSDILDPSWGFKKDDTGKFVVVQDNSINRDSVIGKRTAIALKNKGALAVPPPVQFEPGQMISDVLIPMARRAGLLLNVSSVGEIMFFAPDYTTPAMYTFNHYGVFDEKRIENNVESASLVEGIDGVYTKVSCVGQVCTSGALSTTGAPTAEHPNEGKKRGDYKNTDALPFRRYHSFGDSDQFDKEMASTRAKWKAQRGLFDSWALTYVVTGHSQHGFMYAPDTMCQVIDKVLGLDGLYYISAVRMTRNMTDGTKTTLTLRKPYLLGA